MTNFHDIKVGDEVDMSENPAEVKDSILMALAHIKDLEKVPAASRKSLPKCYSGVAQYLVSQGWASSKRIKREHGTPRYYTAYSLTTEGKDLLEINQARVVRLESFEKMGAGALARQLEPKLRTLSLAQLKQIEAIASGGEGDD